MTFSDTVGVRRATIGKPSLRAALLCCGAVLLAAAIALSGQAQASVIYKAGNNDNINLTSSWWTSETGTINPASIGTSDTLWFGGSGQGATRTLSLGGDLTVGALRLDNITGTPNYSVAINAGNTLTLNGNTDYDGIASGIVLNSSAGGTMTINADLILGASQRWVTSRNLTVGGNVSLGANTLTFRTAAGTTTVSGTISGTGGITQDFGNAGGVVLLTGSNNYTGSTFINIGTLRVTGSGVLGGAAGSTTDANNIVFGTSQANAALEFETSANLGPADQIRFRNTGGTPGSGGNLKYIGTTAQTVGKTLQCDTSIGIRLESNSVGGSIKYNGAFSQTNRPLYLGGTGTGNNELAMAFLGTGGLAKTGVGKWILSASNAYSGTTTVSAGVLSLRNNTALGTTAGGTYIGSAKVQLQGGLTVAENFSSNGGTIENLSDNNTLTGTISKAGNPVTLLSTAGKLTVQGGIAGSNNSLVLQGAGDGEISGPITVAYALTKSGTGTWVLSGNNTYSPSTATFIYEGTISAAAIVVLGGSSSLGNDTSAVVLGDASHQGTLLYTGGPATYTRGFTVGAGGGQLLHAGSGLLSVATGNITTGGTFTVGGASGKDIAISSVISSTGGLTKTGADTLTLSGKNTYQGATTINAGAVSASAIAVLGGSSSLGNATSVVVLGDATNQGTLSYTGAAATYTRGFSLGAGGGQLLNAGSGLLTVQTAGIAGDGSLVLGGTGDVTVSSAIGIAGGLTKTGTDTVTLSGANTHPGPTTISAGAISAPSIVVLGGSSGLGNATSAVVLGDAANQGALAYTGGTAVYTRGLTINAGGGQLTNAGGSLLTVQTGDISAGGTFTVGGALGSDIAIASTISNTGGLTKTGADTVTLSGANTYSGTTTISAGTISAASIAVVGGSSSLGNAATAVVLGDTSNQGTLSYTGGAAVYARGFTIKAGGGQLANVGGALLTVQTGGILAGGPFAVGGDLGSDIAIASVIGSTGALIKTGAGTATLSNTNTFTGTTKVTGGTLRLTNNRALQNSPFDPSGGGTLDLTSVNTPMFGGLTGSGSLALPANVTNLTLNVPGTQTYAGNLTSAVSSTLTKAGAGTQVLSGSNNITGPVVVNAGELRIASADALNGASSITVNSGGDGGLSLDGGIVVDSGKTITINGGGLGQFFGALSNNSGANEWQGNVTLGSTQPRIGVNGTGSLTISGVIDSAGVSRGVLLRLQSNGGAIVLSGANTYLGDTMLVTGTDAVQLAGGANRLPTSTKLIFGTSNTSGILDLNGQDQEVAGISVNSGTANEIKSAAPATFTVNTTAGSPSTYGGKISGGVSLLKKGADTLTLSATNTYSGATTIHNGVLALGALGSFANSSIVIVGDADSSGAVLNLTAKNSPFTFGPAQTLKGIGTVNVGADKTVVNNGTLATGNSIGTLNVTGNYTFGAGSAWPVETDETHADQIIISGAASIQPTAKISFTGATGLGKYVLATAASGLDSGTFTLDGLMPAGYTLTYSAAELDLRHQATIGAITPQTGLKVLQGASVPFTFTVNNSAPTDSLDLVFSAAAGAGTSGSVSGTTTVAPGATSSDISGLSFVGGAAGAGQTAAFSVTDPNAGNTPQTGVVAADVYEPISISSTAGAVTNAVTATLRADAEVLVAGAATNPDFTVSGLDLGTVIAPGGTTGSASMPDTSNRLNGTHLTYVAAGIGYASQGIVGTPTGVQTSINSLASQVVSGNTVGLGNLHTPQTANVPGTQTYAGYSSTLNPDVADSSVGQPTLGTTAELLAGNAGADRALSMGWRARTTVEVGTGPISLLLSDVMTLGGPGGDKFVLQVSYNDSQFAPGQAAQWAAAGLIYLGYLSDGNWTSAVLGNNGPNDPTFQGLAAWTDDTTLGHWGIDTLNNKVWAVLDYEGTFAVVPEPGTLALLACGLMALVLRRLRLSRG